MYSANRTTSLDRANIHRALVRSVKWGDTVFPCCWYMLQLFEYPAVAVLLSLFDTLQRISVLRLPPTIPSSLYAFVSPTDSKDLLSCCHCTLLPNPAEMHLTQWPLFPSGEGGLCHSNVPISLATKSALLDLAEIVTEEPRNSDCCSSGLSVGLLVGTSKTTEQAALPGKLHSVSLLSVPAAGLLHLISEGFDLPPSWYGGVSLHQP